MRTISSTVMFNHPFSIPGIDGEQPPGRYAVSSDEEELNGMESIGWRRTGTFIRLPAIGINSGIEQVHTINPFDLQQALTRDLLLSTSTSLR
ncbi:MAG: hypothetical protein JNM45_00350 [Rhizobiales bacterium]|nr:hypothetical protein [Hyphomicrobiales bacterium]